jgi:TolA-binding protein
VAPWKKLAAEGRYEQAVAAARKVGFEKLTRTLGKGDLWELARAARFAREGELAVTALEAYRDRFAETARAGTAAFLLGRVEMEQNESPAAAARWFRTYLDEQPDGPLAEEALGRLMDAQRKAGQEAAAKKSAQVYLSKHPEGIFKDLAESLLSH